MAREYRHEYSRSMKRALVAVWLAVPCGATAASDDCSVADVLIRTWVGTARNHSAALPTTIATRTELEFRTPDGVALEGYSYSPPSSDGETRASSFVLLLQGSASSAAQLAETAIALALAARRQVFVSEYRGYAAGSTVRPTAAAIQGRRFRSCSAARDRWIRSTQRAPKSSPTASASSTATTTHGRGTRQPGSSWRR